MKLTIQNIEKLKFHPTNRHKLRVLSVVEQRDLYAIEYIYADGKGGETKMFYFVIMREYKTGTGYPIYLVDHAKSRAYPLSSEAEDFQSPKAMIDRLISLGNCSGKLHGAGIVTYKDLRNLTF